MAGLIYRMWELENVNNVEKQNLVLELHDEKYMKHALKKNKINVLIWYRKLMNDYL